MIEIDDQTDQMKKDQEDTATIIARCLKGDRNAFRSLVQTYSSYVYQIAYSVLHDTKEAEDAAQEAFLQVHKSLPDYRSQGFKTWLTRITLNKAIDMKRRRDRRKEEQIDPAEIELHIPHGEDHFLNDLMHEERRREISDRIAQLPEAHRKMITKFYLQGYSHEQIAAEEQVSIKTVESRLYRARAWIRQQWKEEDW